MSEQSKHQKNQQALQALQEKKEAQQAQQELQQVEAKFHELNEHYIEKLKTLVQIPSISFPAFDQSKVKTCSNQVKEYFVEAGLENVQIISMKDEEKPYVYGEWLKAPGQPTLLLYAHYDVQPPGEEKNWQSPPFDLQQREGRLYGRGSADDKGGLMAHLAAIDSWLKTVGKLPVNVKLISEGEEECGSYCLPEFVEKYKKQIQADIIVIIDAENFDTETAGLTISLRGMVTAAIEVKALNQAVHSGLWGGPLPDPAMGLSKILSRVVDEKGEIQIPAIQKMIQPLSEKNKSDLKKLPFDLEKFRKESGLLDSVPLMGEVSEARERLWFRPTFTVNALQASSREQASNIIVPSAWARLSVRTVPNLKAEEVFLALKDFLEKEPPFGLKVEVSSLGGGNWWATPTDHWAFEKIESALEKAWGRKAVKIGCGASIPFVQTFSEALNGAPALLLGVADPLSNAHSANESLSLKAWNSTVKAMIYFMAECRRTAEKNKDLQDHL